MRLSISVIFVVCAFTVSSSLAQQAQPQSGEGAYGLLRRNGIPPNNVVLAEFRELNEGKFTLNGGLRRGVSYNLPAITVDEPLFGDRYRLVELQSDELKGTVWYLIGGHGGPDPGAWAWRKGVKIYEDEYAYDVMLRFGRLLRANGAIVYFITQDDDGIRNGELLKADHDERHITGESISRVQRIRLKERTDLINRFFKRHKGAYQRVVEFHVDSREDSGRQIDVDFHYGSHEGERLARTLRSKMAEKYKEHQPGRGYKGLVKRSGFHTILRSIPVVTYIELGNIQNTGDQERIVRARNRQAVAEWLFEGFLVDVEESR